MSDVTFGTWNAPASPITIEYSLVVIEEIRHEVAEGFQKLSRGGIEVGGLLYGVHDGQTVRIMAIRPVACEHAAGPAFRLSERDRAALQDQLRTAREDSRLDGLVCAGWYISHTRTEISMAESDLEMFSSYFAEPWQVTLVVRPSRGGNMRAGFFVREPDGTINAARSYLEFSFPDRMAAVFDHHRAAPPERQSPEHRSGPRSAHPLTVPMQDIPRPAPPVSNVSSNVPVNVTSSISSNLTTLFGEPARTVAPAPLAASEPVDYSKPASKQGGAKSGSAKKWLWLVAALIVIGGLAAAGARFLVTGAPDQPIALSVLERDGQLDIEWNPQTAPLSKAVSGTLEIADGPQTRNISLKASDLGLGKFSYKRETGDIQVRMTVESSDGKKTEGASRFYGPPPPQGNTEELKALQQRRDELEAEVTRLKQSTEQQAQRIQQLERTLKILQTRQGN